METTKNRSVLTIVDENTNDFLIKMNLGSKFVPIYKDENLFIKTSNKDIFIMSERYKLFSAGRGDWFQLDLLDFTLKRIEPISDDMNSHKICGFINKEHLKFFEYQEVESD